MKTKQEQIWKSDFGKDFIQRNTFNPEELDEFYTNLIGISKTDIIQDFFGGIKKDAKILEIGTSVGNQLIHLKKLGFTNLYGIDFQQRSVDMLHKREDSLNVIQADALDLPFKDDYFDLVFTNYVLIHIAPNLINQAIKEIIRVSNKFIFSLEYFSPTLEEIIYRNNSDLSWKTNFEQLFLDENPNLKVIKNKKYNYVKEPELTDKATLLSF